MSGPCINTRAAWHYHLSFIIYHLRKIIIYHLSFIIYYL